MPAAPITSEELQEIAEFISYYRDEILTLEIEILNRLIRTYQKLGTPDARKELKTFLLYLRRSICPSTPSTPQKIRDFEESSFYQSYTSLEFETTRIETPKPKKYSTPRRPISKCACNECNPSRLSSSSFLTLKYAIGTIKNVIVRRISCS